MRTWQRYVAVGDSFTEGLDDPDPTVQGAFRGWADRLAEQLGHDAAQSGADFGYANLAIRGRLLRDIAGPQVDAALQMQPDLVSIVGGGNDMLRPRVDLDALADELDCAVARIRATGADVLMATPTDPRGAPIMRRTRGRVGIFIAHQRSIAQRHGAHVLDLWSMLALQDWRMWSGDRIHLTPQGHQRVARAAYAALRNQDPHDDWAAPLPPAPPSTRREQWDADRLWAREFVAPWIGRRLRGRSSGDNLDPKRPSLAPVSPTPFDPHHD